VGNWKVWYGIVVFNVLRTEYVGTFNFGCDLEDWSC